MKPATPLPWSHQKPRCPQHAIDRKWEVVSKINTGGEFVVVGEHTGIDCLKEKNAAYISHSANAYPRLVEALTQVARGIPYSKRALDLLRDLGESTKG